MIARPLILGPDAVLANPAIPSVLPGSGAAFDRFMSRAEPDEGAAGPLSDGISQPTPPVAPPAPPPPISVLPMAASASAAAPQPLGQPAVTEAVRGVVPPVRAWGPAWADAMVANPSSADTVVPRTGTKVITPTAAMPPVGLREHATTEPKNPVSSVPGVESGPVLAPIVPGGTSGGPAGPPILPPSEGPIPDKPHVGRWATTRLSGDHPPLPAAAGPTLPAAPPHLANDAPLYVQDAASSPSVGHKTAKPPQVLSPPDQPRNFNAEGAAAGAVIAPQPVGTPISGYNHANFPVAAAGTPQAVWLEPRPATVAGQEWPPLTEAADTMAQEISPTFADAPPPVAAMQPSKLPSPTRSAPFTHGDPAAVVTVSDLDRVSEASVAVRLAPVVAHAQVMTEPVPQLSPDANLIGAAASPAVTVAGGVVQGSVAPFVMRLPEGMPSFWSMHGMGLPTLGANAGELPTDQSAADSGFSSNGSLAVSLTVTSQEPSPIMPFGPEITTLVAVPIAETGPEPRTALLPPPSGVGMPPRVAPDLAAIVAAGPNGPTEVMLAPEELGRVSLTMHQDGDAMRIVITAERGETLDLLRRHGELLLEEFRAAGFSGSTLSFGGWGGTGDHPSPQSRVQPGHGTAEPSQPLFPPPTPLPAPDRAGLDLRL